MKILLNKNNEVLTLNGDHGKIPFDNGVIGFIGKENTIPVFAIVTSETHYRLATPAFGQFCDPIPLQIDTFEKLGQWFQEQRRLEEEREKDFQTIKLQVSILFNDNNDHRVGNRREACCPPQNISLKLPVDLAKGPDRPDQDWAAERS